MPLTRLHAVLDPDLPPLKGCPKLETVPAERDAPIPALVPFLTELNRPRRPGSHGDPGGEDKGENESEPPRDLLILIAREFYKPAHASVSLPLRSAHLQHQSPSAA